MYIRDKTGLPSSLAFVAVVAAVVRKLCSFGWSLVFALFSSPFDTRFSFLFGCVVDSSFGAGLIPSESA